MPFKSMDDLATRTSYEKNLLAGLKASESKVAKLHYFEGFQFDNGKAALVLVGPVESKLVEKIKSSGAALRATGSLMQADDEIRYKAGGVKADILTKALKAAKIKKDAVAVDDLAEAVEEGEVAKPKDTQADPDAVLLKAAKEKLAELKVDYTAARNRASENYKERLKANREDCDKLVEGSDGKAAAKAVALFAQVTADSEKVFASMREAVLRRTVALRQRLGGFKKPPLAEKHKADSKKRLDRPEALMQGAGNEDIAWATVSENLNQLDKVMDSWEALGEAFADQKAGFDSLATQVNALIAQTKAGVVKLDKEKKVAYANLVKELDRQQKKLPAEIDDAYKDPFGEATGTYLRVKDWLMANMVAKGSGGSSGNPVIDRMNRFKHNDPRTWDVNPPQYLNGTSASDLGTHATNLADCSLRSRTSASGSVLKVNFEGHEHLEGGGAGFAFVYKLNADYTVTPTCVDLSGKRGGKNGNQYMWNSGGTWSYFPQNANY